MTLRAGQMLGVYEVVGAIGAGGMGEVYRARDTRLNRDVAIKILPDGFATDAARLTRFTREAQSLAALNHPNIAAIYGIEERALVMEFIPGEDLSQLIARGPLPMPDALAIARQIASALEAAHDHGLVHRDLKPANVRVRPDGTVKVLDFGLAKTVDEGRLTGSDPGASPTVTSATQPGTILGTCAYMSPEQIRGRAVDRRADIWSFGVVCFEMLTGRRVFAGDDPSDVLASVLKTEPDWTRLPTGTPAPVTRLLRRCLEKDPRRRLAAIADARLEVDDAASGAAEASPPMRAPSGRFAWIAGGLVGMIIGMAAVFAVTSSTGSGAGNVTSRVTLLGPPDREIYPESVGVAISPNGRMVAFVVGDVTANETQLWVRQLDTMVARRLEEADGAQLPFWSPDSSRIGFFTTTKLKTIAATGGHADVLADVRSARGGAWSASNTIIYAPDADGPLYRIPSGGGSASAVTSLDAKKVFGHRFPTFLPDGRHFLYLTLPGHNGSFAVFAGSLDDDSRVLIGEFGSAPVYAPPGFLLYARQGGLVAQPFDARALKTMGDPLALDDQPGFIGDSEYSITAGRPTSVGASGALAYFSPASPDTVAVWIDRTGAITGRLRLPSAYYDFVSVAPDGAHAALERTLSPSESSLVQVDLSTGTVVSLTTGGGRNDGPVWSPDGSRIVFASDRDGPLNLFVKNVRDAAPERAFFQSDALFKAPRGWSADDHWITMTQFNGNTVEDTMLVSTDEPPKVTPFVQGPKSDFAGPPAPNGRWAAYYSGESGSFELYVQSFPTPGRPVQVSTDTAERAWWSKDSRELLYISSDRRSLWRAEVGGGTDFHAGVPERLATFPPGIVSVDAMPDHRRFLALVPARLGSGTITVVQHWDSGLSRR